MLVCPLDVLIEFKLKLALVGFYWHILPKAIRGFLLILCRFPNEEMNETH